MKREDAALIANHMLEISDRLARTTQVAKTAMPEADFLSYRDEVATFMADVLYVQLTNIFREFPDLKPEDWNW